MPAGLPQSWMMPLLSMLMGLIGAWMSIQISVEQRLTRVEGRIEAAELRIVVIDEWVIRTEANRFTHRDGVNLDQRLRDHAGLPSHGSVSERLAELEVRIRALERGGAKD